MPTREHREQKPIGWAEFDKKCTHTDASQHVPFLPISRPLRPMNPKIRARFTSLKTEH